ncbi:unnamed protein product [Larinioides sclopetarius]|uniref:Uncharacterized protein n=1 Tax=Larinioides sclopetarius TaxID=280406 RepID=A0AAV2AXS0_9ARAC
MTGNVTRCIVVLWLLKFLFTSRLNTSFRLF